MKKLILVALILLSSQAWAQEVRTIYPEGYADGATWVEIDASSSGTLKYDFAGSRRLGAWTPASYYGGFLEVVIYCDTTVTNTHGDGDSVTYSIRPLFYDAGDDSLKATSAAAASQDTTVIVTDLDWENTDNDAQFDLNVSANLPPCDGAQVNVYTGAGGALRTRVELRTYIIGKVKP